MGFRELRAATEIEEIDYPLLLTHLQEYANPRGKIGRLLKEEKIIRIKKGLYVFGPNYRRGLVCKEALANLIYGPSYISYTYALSFHNILPERVETVTSATTGKSKSFLTPVGGFSYTHTKPNLFALGVDQLQLDAHHFILMASPEKALIDLCTSVKKLSPDSIPSFLYEDLRIEREALIRFSSQTLSALGNAISLARVKTLVDFISQEQRDG